MRSIRNAAIAAAASSAVAGPGLTGSRTSARSRRRAAARLDPANEKRTAPDGPLPGVRMPARQVRRAVASSKRFAAAATGVPTRRDVVGAEPRATRSAPSRRPGA